MFADEIRRAVEAAPRVKLPDVAALLWRAFGAGQVTEAEAEALSEPHRGPEDRASRARQPARRPVRLPARAPMPPWSADAAGRLLGGSHRSSRPGSRWPRRRCWPSVASETVRRGDCRLCIDHIAAIAGVAPLHREERHPAGADARPRHGRGAGARPPGATSRTSCGSSPRNGRPGTG